MAAEPTTQPAAASGPVSLGDLTVNRMGFGAMRLTGSGVWGDPPDREGAKAVLRRAVELGVTLIDTAASYGPEVNEELLAELQRQGKIRHVGLSNVDARQLATAQEIVPVVSVQNRYNVGDRYSDRVLDACERAGIAFLPWFPLALGALASATGRLAEIARSHGGTPAQVALAWLLRRSPGMAPIPGNSSVEHLEEDIAAAELPLTHAEFTELSRAAES